MRAVLLTEPGKPLEETELPVPSPAPGELLVRVEACGVCRTDLHVRDGELARPKLPLVLGHEIVGTVERSGDAASRFAPGDRVGIPWLGWTCGRCRFCAGGRENLCRAARFTGYTLDGGFAEYTAADARYCFPLSRALPATEAAPLLCAGLIGYRSLLRAGRTRTLGLYGFGSAARLLLQVARFEGRDVYAFTRPEDIRGQESARRLGAVWAGDSDQSPPVELEAAIIFAPAGALVPRALRAVEPGGTVVCGGIHMSDIPAFPYSLLWEERAIASVANLTRKDGEEFLELATRVPVRTQVEVFALSRAEEAIERLRRGELAGTAVLTPGGG
jgi:propanol-preferring alcohol dehydrogenase